MTTKTRVVIYLGGRGNKRGSHLVWYESGSHRLQLGGESVQYGDGIKLGGESVQYGSGSDRLQETSLLKVWDYMEGVARSRTHQCTVNCMRSLPLPYCTEWS